MATKQEVKRYLAYWFQLGKKVITGNGEASFLPQDARGLANAPLSVLNGDRYSEEFEECWQKIISPESGDCYLEGTYETIAELLTPAWNMLPCSRCSMPIAARNVGMPALLCPCNDLPNWPNTELPAPREPIKTQDKLQTIRDRLVKNIT
ncbi:hypothetical protein [Nostoc sp. 'Lobaria pulmonaria (5183) cyanobiont']|uniref:hypothetical protein n=1 Tax=Nostoc sp. 'Lobaria pulmonaria (5183) cyanobiont' TaxID=1618022 RepID=UPI000CF30423|nr:hypothetical protein [Nostoc sp. 'Lobaria pulmonaria (5183) cyanobiont']AVH72415.1 hypothetical protein NLP_3910 [Nostoc sp. 'Lobaria pulmonaria (5183) cyanobiont']